MTHCILIGAPVDSGQQRPGCLMGPAAYRVARLGDTLAALGALAAHWRSRFALPVIAVTGSNGKTTTSTLVHAALEAAGEHAGVVTTVGARLGGRTRETLPRAYTTLATVSTA